jgi:Fe-S cluster biogenesis protein NfuA
MDTVADRVREVLRRLQPALSVDGGGVELDRVEGTAVFLRFTGTCIGCPGADITLRYGLESALTEALPEITSVTAVPGESPPP